MKIAGLVSRILLGLIFVVFGLNGFLQFIPMPPPSGLAAEFFHVVTVSHYMVLVFLLQLVGGALLLVNRYVPLALTLLAPVIVNIVQFHALIAPAGLPLAFVVVVLWLLVFWRERAAFRGLFAQSPSRI